MNRPTGWQSQAYLDALRPNPGCEVRGAILTSYSADIASIVAALLALAARDNDSGSGGKTDLAEAIELLRGKVRILIQRGRLARPKRIPLIAGILDQFVREIDFDESKHSWHPKVSLVEFANGNGTSDWRMWLGSRNLTAAVNRDFGLLLSSETDPQVNNASPIPGAGTMAQRFAEYAALKTFRPTTLRSAINAVRWTHPDRFRVERITLTGGKGADNGPSPSQDLDEVIAISPFLDGGVVKVIGSWGGVKTRRFLLSTELALTKIAGQAGKPLSGFKDNLFVLDMPAPEAVEPSSSAPSDDSSAELLAKPRPKLGARPSKGVSLPCPRLSFAGRLMRPDRVMSLWPVAFPPNAILLSGRDAVDPDIICSLFCTQAANLVASKCLSRDGAGKTEKQDPKSLHDPFPRCGFRRIGDSHFV